MKKLTTLLLTAVLLLSMCFTALAANKAPSKDYDPDPTNGHGAWSYVEVTPYSGRSSQTAYVFSNYQTTTMPIEGKVTPVSGLSYNKKTNTLTMKNYKEEDMMLLVHNMGTGFTINLSGTNQLRCITVDNDKWDSGLTIKGEGSITLGNSGDHGHIPLSVNGKLTIESGKIRCLAEVTDIQTSYGLRYSVFVTGTSKTSIETAVKWKGNLEGTVAADTSARFVSSKDDVTFSGKAIDFKTDIKRKGKKVSWGKLTGYQYQYKIGSKITTTKKTSVKSAKKVQVRLVKTKDGITSVGAWSKKV